MNELTADQQAIIDKIIKEKLEAIKSEAIAETKAKLAEVESKLNHAYSSMALDTVAGIIMLNKHLTTLQKEQICAIIAGPKRDFTYYC